MTASIVRTVGQDVFVACGGFLKAPRFPERFSGFRSAPNDGTKTNPRNALECPGVEEPNAAVPHDAAGNGVHGYSL